MASGRGRNPCDAARPIARRHPFCGMGGWREVRQGVNAARRGLPYHLAWHTRRQGSSATAGRFTVSRAAGYTSTEPTNAATRYAIISVGTETSTPRCGPESAGLSRPKIDPPCSRRSGGMPNTQSLPHSARSLSAAPPSGRRSTPARASFALVASATPSSAASLVASDRPRPLPTRYRTPARARRPRTR
jgi:hypothetical protein